MTLTFKYDTPINDFMDIPAGTKVTRIDWSEYEGFTAVEYKGEQFYFSNDNFVEVDLLNELSDNTLVEVGI